MPLTLILGLGEPSHYVLAGVSILALEAVLCLSAHEDDYEGIALIFIPSHLGRARHKCLYRCVLHISPIKRGNYRLLEFGYCEALAKGSGALAMLR